MDNTTLTTKVTGLILGPESYYPEFVRGSLQSSSERQWQLIPNCEVRLEKSTIP